MSLSTIPGIPTLRKRPVVQNRLTRAVPDVVALAVDDAGQVVRYVDDHPLRALLPAPFANRVFRSVRLTRLLSLDPAFSLQVCIKAVLVGGFRLDLAADDGQPHQGIFPAITGCPCNCADNAVASPTALWVFIVKMEGRSLRGNLADHAISLLFFG